MHGTMDDTAKDGGLEEVRLLGTFYHDPLHAQITTNVNNLANLNNTGLHLNTAPSGVYLKLNYKYELCSLLNTEVSAAKDHGKKYRNVNPPLVHHL